MPEHEHIYSNGFICMSILYDGNKISYQIVNKFELILEKLNYI